MLIGCRCAQLCLWGRSRSAEQPDTLHQNSNLCGIDEKEPAQRPRVKSSVGEAGKTSTFMINNESLSSNPVTIFSFRGCVGSRLPVPAAACTFLLHGNQPCTRAKWPPNCSFCSVFWLVHWRSSVSQVSDALRALFADDAFAAAPSSLLRLYGRRWSHRLICMCVDPVIMRTPDAACIFCSAAVSCCPRFRAVPASAVFAAAQGILKLAGMDENCQQLLTIQECTAKMQMTVSQLCTVQLQPDLPVAQDGSFCSPSKGVNARGEGQQMLWRTDLRMHTHPTLIRPPAPTRAPHTPQSLPKRKTNTG